ncbi:hypothetical protein [Salipaludibacillus aurantiacus]|uniref:Uncharacterized protein n=1 Tax=Salipaludibacillus aurantiacus TaxID=1601833 RepID=A0A1H9VSH6_9BACI|nr:hypothetical protein [Salipaludibacillus aurantiacus]SES24454.1 hypothetical protein SAMN05518684_11256 [Salipaludibacillus aurantiacus]
MKKLDLFSNYLYRKTGFKTWLLSFIIFSLFLTFILPETAATTERITGTGESPDGSYVYTSDDIYRMAEEYGEEGREYYIRSRFTFDIVWPLVYLFFLYTSLTNLYRSFQSVKIIKYSHLLPFGAVLFDFFENTSASVVMARYPSVTPVIAELATVFTFIKWNLIYTSFAVLFAGLLIKGILLIRRLAAKWK